MKLLFIHTSEKLKEDKNGDFYTDGSYNTESWNRYLALSNDLTVIFRKEDKKYDVEYAKNKFNPLKKEIKFIEIKDRNKSVKEYLNLKNIRLNNELIKNAVKECDYLIVRGLCVDAIKYAKKYEKTYLIEIVGCVFDSLWNHSFKGKILSFKNYFNLRRIVRNAPYALYVTRYFLQKRYPCKGKSIDCSDVVINNLDENILEKRLDKIKNKKLNDKIIVGTVGAIDVRYKGQEYVIKAISILNREGYNFEYHIVGSGNKEYLSYIAKKNNILDKVKFLGSLTHEEVFQYLDSIDIYIQSSKTEGLPRALIEAMSRGCPSLGTNVGGIPELLNEDNLYKPTSVYDIRDKLKGMNKESMIENCKKNIEKSKMFNKKILDDRRMKFYKSFINQI